MAHCARSILFALQPLILAALAGCGVDPIAQALFDQGAVDLTSFPPDFMWGAAGSAHQNEGGDVDSDWWAWENAGRTQSGDVSGMAADQYHRYEEDFDRLL